MPRGNPRTHFSVKLDAELFGRMERERKRRRLDRTAFVEAAVEAALGSTSNGSGDAGVRPGPGRSASPRSSSVRSSAEAKRGVRASTVPRRAR